MPREGVYANVWTPRLGAYMRPVGQASLDGIAKIGREGVIFLDGERTTCARNFTGDFELPDGWADAWRALVREREEAFAAMSARAAWLVVPDKLAVDFEHLTERLAVGRRPVQLLR